MIRHDFKYGGFPINRTCPVLCFADGLHVAYNHEDLHRIIQDHDNIQCYGVWPGKWDTDVFILYPDAYKNYKPPKGHEKIVNGKDIIIYRKKELGILKITYTLWDEQGDPYLVETKDPSLYVYIISARLHHRTCYV